MLQRGRGCYFFARYAIFIAPFPGGPSKLVNRLRTPTPDQWHQDQNHMKRLSIMNLAAASGKYRHPLYPGPGDSRRSPGGSPRPAQLFRRARDAANPRGERARSAPAGRPALRLCPTVARDNAKRPRCATCCRRFSTVRRSRLFRRSSTIQSARLSERRAGSPCPHDRAGAPHRSIAMNQ